MREDVLITQLSITMCQPCPFNLFFHWSDLRKWHYHPRIHPRLLCRESLSPMANPASLPLKHLQKLSLALHLHCYHPGQVTITSLVDAYSSLSLSAYS